jgi:hypothetical protein
MRRLPVVALPDRNPVESVSLQQRVWSRQMILAAAPEADAAIRRLADSVRPKLGSADLVRPKTYI